MATAFSYDQLKSALWAEQGARVHAVIDGLVVPGLAKRLEAADTAGWDCLQRGALSPAAAERVAYLAELKPESEFTDWLLRDAATAFPGWGVLIVSRHPLLQVREHCRAIGDAVIEEGERRAWRWYDPELLELLLPGLSASQLDEFFALGQGLVVPARTAWSFHGVEQGVLASTVRPAMAMAA